LSFSRSCWLLGYRQSARPGERPPILLFDGNGTSPDDVAALRAVLSRAQLRFDTADSPRLNAMSAQELRGYRLLIVPGGNFERIGNALSGAGWVILVGVHPEAPAAWRRGLAFSSPVAQDNAYAETLIRAALAGTRLRHF